MRRAWNQAEEQGVCPKDLGSSGRAPSTETGRLDSVLGAHWLPLLFSSSLYFFFFFLMFMYFYKTFSLSPLSLSAVLGSQQN